MENIAFGRIAAQTAKQVIVQRVRDAEREVDCQPISVTAWASCSTAPSRK